MKNLRGKVDAQGFYVAGGGVGTVELVALDQHKLIASQFERNMLSSRSSSLVEMTNSIPAWLHFGNDALIKRSSFLKNTMIAFVIFYSTKLIKRIVSENRLV